MESEINICILGSMDDFVVINQSTPNALLSEMLNSLYSREDSYNTGQSDRALIAKWKTNARYQMSEVPSVPIFGYKQVDLSGSFENVSLYSKIFNNAEEFLEAFQSVIWITYRYGFEPIIYKDKIFTSDTGWGCTIRVGQMLLLNTLKFHFRLSSSSQLLELIQENLTAAPFSLHKIVECGKNFNKNPGDWYSPALISHVIQALSETFEIPGMKILVCMDNTIYKNKIPENEACLILIPFMLGIENIQPEYYEVIKRFLSLEWTVGIIGGIPKSALYIVGFQGDNLLFLDPHFVQLACTSGQDLLNKINTYQCSSPKLLPLSVAESSLSVGFYFRNKNEFYNFENFVSKSTGALREILNFKDKDIDSNIQEDNSDEDFYLV